MKKEDLIVRCVYDENAGTVEEILLESFRLFLQKELLAEGQYRHVSCL